mmetsp:Transcript_55344/g.109990  ORF Transcript_55344/g.109990 Transcript_55344/m.109990 type:complete len:136 (-) Transcript_55344:1007-1414(-)
MPVVVAPLAAHMQRAEVWDSAVLGWDKAPLLLQILDAALGQEHLTPAAVLVAQKHHAEAWGVRVLRELGPWLAPVIGRTSARGVALTQDQEGTTSLAPALATGPKRRWRPPTVVVSGRVACSFHYFCCFWRWFLS